MASSFGGHETTNCDADDKGGEFMENNEVPSPLPKHPPMSQRVRTGGDSQRNREDNPETPGHNDTVQERKTQISHEQRRNEPPCWGEKRSDPKMLSGIDEEDILCQLNQQRIFQILFSKLAGHFPQCSGLAASCSHH